MSQITFIPIEAIDRRADTRVPDDETIASLAESIQQVGLINPVRVRPAGDRFELIAGSHRYAACDSLGHHEIAAFVVKDDDLHAELAMIDENLCRAELSPSDRARQTARRKAIYEEMHPVAAHGGDRKSDQVAKSATRSFAVETAAVTGSAARTVRLDAERGAKVTDAVLDMVRGTRLDTGAYLDRMKNLSPHEQVTAARRDLEAPAPVARPAPSHQSEPDPAALYLRFCELAEEIAAMPAAGLIAGAGRQRSALAGWVSTLAEKMDAIWTEVDR